MHATGIPLPPPLLFDLLRFIRLVAHRSLTSLACCVLRTDIAHIYQISPWKVQHWQRIGQTNGIFAPPPGSPPAPPAGEHAPPAATPHGSSRAPRAAQRPRRSAQGQGLGGPARLLGGWTSAGGWGRGGPLGATRVERLGERWGGASRAWRTPVSGQAGWAV